VSPPLEPDSTSIPLLEVTEQELQYQRRQNRIASLEFWKFAIGHAITLHMFANTTVHGTLVAVDSKQAAFVVSQLATPIGVYKHAIIRASDIIDIEVDL
jgi:small nuclear ribonucleoprotein (snRNP)-like protein